MMGRIYTVVFTDVAVAAAQDLFEISPADDKPIELVGLFIANVGGTADAGDAQEELLQLDVLRGFTASGSGGSAPTPRPLGRSDAAAGFAAEVNNTTLANTGTSHTLHSDGFNIRTGYQLWWPPEARPTAGQGDTTIVVRLTDAPADSVQMSGTLYVRELN